MNQPVTVLMVQPSNPKTWTIGPDVVIPAITCLISVLAIFATLVVAWMQKRTQESLKEIQSQKLNLDLYDKRMKVYLAAKELLDKSLGNLSEIDESAFIQYYDAFNVSRFLFKEGVVNYLNDLYKHATNVTRNQRLLDNSKEMDPYVYENINSIIDESRKWLVNQHEIGGGVTNPRIVEIFKGYLDFSNIQK